MSLHDGAWSVPQVIDDRAPTDSQYLPVSLSCASSTFCMAGDLGGHVLTYDGTSWSAPSSVPLPTNAQPVEPVICASSTFCVVGVDFTSVDVFDGTGWSGPAVLDPPGGLNSVSCPTATFCVAPTTGGYVTFDGTSWTRHEVPSWLTAGPVSCPAINFCASVDVYGEASTFDGSSWTAPTQIPLAGGVTDVSCASAQFCVAVDDVGRAFTFDGAHWSAPANIEPVDALIGYLLSVSCPTVSFCMAVDASGHAVSWNGTTWSAPVAVSDSLVSVSCPTATFCLAAGAKVSTYDGTERSTGPLTSNLTFAFKLQRPPVHPTPSAPR